LIRWTQQLKREKVSVVGANSHICIEDAEMKQIFEALKLTREDIKKYKSIVKEIRNQPKWFIQAVRLSVG